MKTLKMSRENKIKILLVRITNRNFGDSVIADNTRYLIEHSLPYFSRKRYEIFDYAINTEDLAQIKYVDAIIFAGGGLIKFRQEQLYRQVSEIIMEAQKYEIPVMLNAVGVEGYDGNDPRCLQLENALKQPCVKVISVRDDVGGLKENYSLHPSTRIRSVFDPAIWSEKTYQTILKKRKNKGYIGLGIARETLFCDYGIPSIDRNYLMNLWKNIALQLEERGYQWKIFTNGLEQDERFAKDVLDEIGHGEMLLQPLNASMLVSTIGEMQGMIACRMHSNIIAYALKIPSVGLVWNDKMRFWGEKIGYPERFIDEKNLQAEGIVDTLEHCFMVKQRKPSWKQRHSTEHEIKWFIYKFTRLLSKQYSVIDNLEDHIVATALGGYEFKYKNLNSLPQMEKSALQGFEKMELDVRMSKDGQLVCVNGWGKKTWKTLGSEEREGETDVADFLSLHYYDYFPTCTFDMAIEQFSSLNLRKKKLILDVGKPRSDLLEEFYSQLVSILLKHDISPSDIIVRMQRERDVNTFLKQKFNCQIAYFISAEVAQLGVENEQFEKLVHFCKKKKIHIISMTEKTWTHDLQERLESQGFDTMILSYIKVGDIVDSVQFGAKYVATHYYSADYIKKLVQ